MLAYFAVNKCDYNVDYIVCSYIYVHTLDIYSGILCFFHIKEKSEEEKPNRVSVVQYENLFIVYKDGHSSYLPYNLYTSNHKKSISIGLILYTLFLWFGTRNRPM